MSYGVPPLLKFGSKQLQERFLPELLLGKKRTCIAITEPEAGSDVANIQTTATKTPDGRHYVVNGSKKWWVDRLLNSYLPELFTMGLLNMPTSLICRLDISLPSDLTAFP